MAYTQEELEALRQKYPGIDINAIQQAQGGGTVAPPIISPEQAAINQQNAIMRQSPTTALGGNGPGSGTFTPSVDPSGNLSTSTGTIAPGDHTLNFWGNLSRLPYESTAGLFPVKDGNDMLTKITGQQPIYETSNKPLTAPTPFGGHPVTAPPAQGTPVLNPLVNQIGDALKGLAPGGGAPAPPPGQPLNPSMFGWGNFTPGAEQQAQAFFQQGANAMNTAAPQLQRTSIDFSGMGSGQQAPSQPMTQTTSAPRIVGSPPPATQTPSQPVATNQRAFEDMQRGLIAPASPAPSTGGGGGGGGGSAPMGTYGPQQAPAPAIRAQAPAGQPIGPVPTSAPPQAPAPAPAPTGGGQFANPLFAQSQQTRNAQGQLMGDLTSPSMFENPMQQTESAGRAAEMTALNRAANPNMFNTGDAANAAQSRNVQGATMAATTSPTLYNTPGAAQQEQGRQQQQGFLNRLEGDMNGAQPSLAELTLRRGSDAVVANANALAASAGPGGAAMARRQAMQTAAAQGGKLAADSAELRAKEYATARGETGQALTNFRGQDITNQGQGFQNITATADRAAQQAIALRTADLQAAGMSYDNAIKQAQLEQTGAQGIRAGDIQRLGQEYTNTTQQAQLASQMAIQSRAQDLQALGMSYDNAVKQAQLEADQNKAQLSADLQQRGLNLQGELGLYGMGLDVQHQDLQSRMHLADLEAQKYAADRNYQFQQTQADNARFDKYLGMGLTGAGLLLSDETKKTDIRDADDEDVTEFLEEIEPSMFGYKEPEKFGAGEHFGFMAQDLERSRLGKLLVVTTPHGKMVDQKKATMAALASAASLSKRVARLEER